MYKRQEHAHLHEIGRAEYVSITDEQAVKAFEYLSKTEGVIPAIESSHAVAAAMEIVPTMSKDQSVVICLSGRGDKDVYQVARYRGVQSVSYTHLIRKIGQSEAYFIIAECLQKD